MTSTPLGALPPTTCERCAGLAGAHQSWCFVASLWDRFTAPPAPAITPEQVAEIATRAAVQAATDAARAVVAELLRGRPTAEAVLAQQLSEAVERSAQPEPAKPTPAAEKAPAASPVVAMERSKRRGFNPELAAAADLFVETCVQRDDAAAPLRSRDVMAAYEAWRPSIDAPALQLRHLGEAMCKAGFAKRQVQVEGGTKPVHYLGARLREVAPAQEDHAAGKHGAEAARSKCYCDTEGVYCHQHRRAAPARADRYTGLRPGGELSHDFRVAINKWLDEYGPAGFAYERNGVNGGGKPRLVGPAGGRPFTLPNTPSDFRALRNTLASVARWREDQLSAAEAVA